MSKISATGASKRFADMLDAVEHRGETFTVVRRGRVIATAPPARRTTLAELRVVHAAFRSYAIAYAPKGEAPPRGAAQRAKEEIGS